MLVLIMLLVMSGLFVMLVVPWFGARLLRARLSRRMLRHRCPLRTSTRGHFLMPCLRLSVIGPVQFAVWLQRA